jgi:TRAP-type C4-dicarboxylate transport system permease small subunit
MTEETPSTDTILGKLAQLTLYVACAALVGVAAVEGWQVFARYVLSNSPSWTEPIALLLMSSAMMGGAAVGVRGNRHFGFFMLVDHSPPKIRRFLKLLPMIAAFGVGVLFVIAGGHLVSESWDFPMPGAPLPQGAVYLPICIGGALISIFAFERLFLMRNTSGQSPVTGHQSPT